MPEKLAAMFLDACRLRGVAEGYHACAEDFSLRHRGRNAVFSLPNAYDTY